MRSFLHRLFGFRRTPMTAKRALEILQRARIYKDIGAKLR